MSPLAKLLLFVVGVTLGWIAVSVAARRLPPGRAYPRLVPTPARGRLSSAPELRLLAPPAAEVEASTPGLPVGATDAGEVIVRDRTKSSEVVALASRPGWEAELRDRGHKRGYVIRVRRTGADEPLETVQAEGLLRAAARDLAISLLRSRPGPDH